MSRIHLLLLILLFAFTSCEESENKVTPDQTPSPNDAVENEQQKNESATTNTSIVRSKTSADHILKDDVLNEDDLFRYTNIDTTIDLSDTLSIHIQYIDTSFTSNYFSDQSTIDSLISELHNSQLKAAAIQHHQLKSVSEFVKYDTASVSVKLADGSWKQLVPNESKEEAHLLFEKYFDKLGYYSIFLQLYEGVSYIMVSEKSGTKTYLFGRPYFSPSGKYMISTNADLEAGYTKNGFQLYYNVDGELHLLAEYEPNNWAPTNVLWLDDNQLLIDSYILSANSESFYEHFTLKMTIND